MGEQSLKDRAVKGLIWSSVERFSVQGVQFLVMLVIARILSPKDYGLIGMLTIFIAVGQSLVNCGFSQALIRKKDRTEKDNSTVFYFNIVFSLIIYIILFSVSPWVADFFNEERLTLLMRVLCFVIVINSFAIVQQALLTADINFKVQARASFIAAITSGSIGIAMALNGFGVWTLVYQQLLSSLVNVLLLWWNSSWRPTLQYSWKSFNELFSFGSKLLAVGLIDTVFNNIYQIVIGKVFSASSLGHYTRAQHFAELPSSNVTGVLQRVTYPVLCSIQDDDTKLSNSYRQILKLSAFVVFPIMCLLAAIAHPLITILIGDKWDFAATLLIPLCFSLMWYPIHSINLNLLQVKGRSDLFLKLEIIKKILSISVLVLSIPFGVIFMCYSRIFTSIICLVVNTYYTGKLIRVGFFMQMKDLSGTLAVSLIIFGFSYVSTMLFGNVWIQLIMGVLVAVSFFALMVWAFKFKELENIKSLIKK